MIRPKSIIKGALKRLGLDVSKLVSYSAAPCHVSEDEKNDRSPPYGCWSRDLVSRVAK